MIRKKTLKLSTTLGGDDVEILVETHDEGTADEMSAIVQAETAAGLAAVEKLGAYLAPSLNKFFEGMFDLDNQAETPEGTKEEPPN